MADRDPGGANDPDKTKAEVGFVMDFSVRTIDQPAMCEQQPEPSQTDPPGGVPCMGGPGGYTDDT